MTYMNFYKSGGMKIALVILFLIPVITGSELTAQQPVAKEKLDAYRIAFFTRRLNLTSEEAEKFWPVYNELQNRKNQIQQERAQINRKAGQSEQNLSDKEMIELADNLVSLDIKEAGLTQEYHKKFKEILPPVKVVRLYQAENLYRLQLLQELRQLQENRFNPPPGRGPAR